MVKLCTGCGKERLHRARADNPKKLRPTCVDCQAAATKAWRQKQWPRRKAYDTWKGMIARCHNPRTRRFWPGCGIPTYREYGELGIKVCRRWRGPNGFKHFLADLGLPPTPKHTLDRIRVSGNYTPSNTRWSTPEEQARNRRGVRVIRAACPATGVEVELCVAEWERRLDVRPGTITKRLNRGWTEAEALSGVSARRRERARAVEHELAEVPF